MAKLEMTEREKRWQRVLKEYDTTARENPGATPTAIFKAVGKELHLAESTVRDIVKRLRHG